MNPKNFDELVSLMTMRLIEGITRGEGLRGIVFQMLDGAIRWSQENRK